MARVSGPAVAAVLASSGNVRVMHEEARHLLRAGFGDAAEAFDRTRPVCPAALFDDLVSVAGLGPGARVAEIGCGTGQATVPLAARGLAVTAVELSPALAGLARRRLAGFPGAEVVTEAFERWRPERAGFDAVVAVSSLHWIDPGLRYAGPHRLLRPGGALAVAGCQFARAADGGRFWTEVQEDYRAVGYAGEPPPPADEIAGWHFPPEAAAWFTETVSLRYPFRRRYSAADYVDLLSTQSGTRALGERLAAEFVRRVGARLESLGSPDLTVTFVARLTIGRRRG